MSDNGADRGVASIRDAALFSSSSTSSSTLSSTPSSIPSSASSSQPLRAPRQAPLPKMAQPPLHITVRFLSLPDMPIDVADPNHTTAIVLKPLIREQLRRAETAAAAAAAAAAGPTGTAGTAGATGATGTTGAAMPAGLPPSSPLHGAHRRRLRLIYGGKIVADDAVIGSVLRPLSPPPPPSGVEAARRGSPAAAAADHHQHRHSHAALRVYVNCSMGDYLPEKALAAEGRAAAAASKAAAAATATGKTATTPAATSGRTARRAGQTGRAGAGGVQADAETDAEAGPSSSSPSLQRRPAAAAAAAAATTAATTTTATATATASSTATSTSTTSTSAAPRGFDRLLAAGFSTAEVNQLRLQFRSIQAARHTPDTMPSADVLRSLEDRWLDSGGGWQGGGGGAGADGDVGGGGGAAAAASDADPSAAAAAAAAAAADDEFGMPGLLDSMVRGMMIGFLWPLASVGWLTREPGLWSRRWQVFVSFGVVLSVVIGTIKSLAGEW